MAVADPYGFQKPFALRLEQRGKSAILSLAGEFDLTSKKEFEAGLSDIASRALAEVIVDLRGVTFIDSAGLRLILEAWSQCRRGGFDFGVLLSDGRLRGVFQETGLDQTLPIVEGIPG
jgi:anti-sigma B factor antagonist